MKKVNLFIDFDNTIVNTTEAAVKVYNELFDGNVNYMDIENYNMYPQIKLNEKEIYNLFHQENLYKYLTPYKGVYEVLDKLKESKLFNLYLVTNCSPESIPHKIKWLRDNNFDKFFDGKIYLDIMKGYDKSTINMADAIFIDDHRENHLSSNAKYKLSFKHNDKQNWGPDPQNDNVMVFQNWGNGIYLYIEHIAKNL